jgi:hypothetical protein
MNTKLTFKGKSIEAGKTIFNNGKVERHNPIPWKQSSYRNAHGIIVDFKKLPLKVVGKGGQLEDMTRPDRDANNGVSIVTYDEILDFSRSRTLQLDNVIHAEVIQAIRDWDRCVSASKSEGERTIDSGMLIEHEPDIYVDREYDNTEELLNVNDAISKMRLPSYEGLFYILCAYFDIVPSGTAKYPKKEMFNNFSSSFGKVGVASKLLNVIEDPDKDSGVYLDVVMKPEFYKEAIVKLAFGHGIITEQNGTFMMGSIDLGTDLGKIHITNPEKLARLTSELQSKVDFKLTDREVKSKGVETIK